MKFKSAKSILSQYSEFGMSNEELLKMHNVLFHMLKDLKACCEKHGLVYMLCGGTLLGAIRHKGFIPWDDDVDVMMPRRDFQTLAQCMLEDYGEKYEVKDQHILKVLLKGTRYKEIWNDDPNGCHSIYIDVYPIDNMPKGKRRIRAWRFFWAKHAGAFILDYKYPSKHILELEKKDKSIAAYYKKRRMLGRLFNLFGGLNHYNAVAKKLAEYKKETGYLGIPLISYNREKFKSEILTETIQAQFCNELFTIPAHYDEYLKNLYGSDYMIPPPPEKREVHASVEIDFGIYEKLNERGEFEQ